MKKYGLVALVCIATLVWACEKSPTREPVFTGKGGMGALGTGGSLGTGGFSFDGGGLGDANFNETDAPPAPATFTKAALLKGTAECALGLYEQFNTKAVSLQASVASYAAAPTAESLLAAQTAWRIAMGTWQQAEAFQFGPAAGTSEVAGQALRDQIYSFPPVSRCQVDVQLVNQAYAKPDFANSFITGRGLGALEYLLFYAGATNACPAQSEINNKGTWAALPAAELLKRRTDYAVGVANAVVPRGQALVSAWQGGFKQQFETAGTSSTLFATDQAALNAAFDGLFFVEFAVRDSKLGDPLGLTLDCAAARCPQALESPYSRESTTNIVNNIVGVKRLLLGCDASGAAIGFDDWLVAANQAAVADQLRTLLNNALALATTLTPPLEDAITTAPDKVVALREAVRQLTMLLKMQFASVLNLDLPMSVEGDND